MTRSRSHLVAAGCDGETRVLRAAASVPQRWTAQRQAGDGWVEVVHQLVGDGFFGGDVARTCIDAGPGARLAIRGVAATPLRAGSLSFAATHIRVGAGASLIYAPGALIPHGGSAHAGALRIAVAQGGRALVASVITPGRTGMGERGVFNALRLRTVATVGGELSSFEDAAVEPQHSDVDGPAMWAGADAAIAVSIFGEWPPCLFSAMDGPGIVGGSGALRAGGTAYRGLAATLGAAQDAVERLIAAARYSSPTS